MFLIWSTHSEHLPCPWHSVCSRNMNHTIHRRDPWASVLHQGREHTLRSQSMLIPMCTTHYGRKEMHVFLLSLMRRHVSHETSIQSRYRHFEWQHFVLNLEHASLLVILYDPTQNFLRSYLDKAIRTMGAPVFSKRKQYLCYFNCSEHRVYMIQTNICEWISKCKQWKHINQTDSF